MKKEHWDQISTIVDKILTLNKEEQESYLSKTLAGQDALIKEVKEYLEAIEASEDEQFLEESVSTFETLFKDLSDTVIPKVGSDSDLIGLKVGPYIIKSLIAKGGMGSVYLASRNDGQFDQDVAIKLINQRNLSEQGKRRFKQEQKILANLRHPNIAMLLDGGVTENGYPFLILEYIDGTPIDEYCNDHQLDVAKRLDLFKKVLETIEFAHSNLVIHRDLKPNNIFVTENGEVKILDFGIAKLLDKDEEEDLLLTQPGQRLWTPSYAAPEQVKEQPPVTQTDVYALGGLLHRLLSNTSAFDFSDKKLHEVEKIILEETPAGLISAIDSQENSEILECFGVNKFALKNQVKGDLEAIVSKALRKEPYHRYHSVSLFLEDIQRFENNLPISAKKDNVKYLAQKFFKRNKQPLLYALIVITAIIGVVSYYTLEVNEQRRIAELEAEKATQVSDYLSKLFSKSYPENSKGKEITASELLELGIGQLSSLDNQPEVQVAMLNLFANIYQNMQDLETADSLVKIAIDVNQQQENVNNKELAFSFYTQGLLERDNGNYDESIRLIEESLVLEGMTNTAADSTYASRLSSLAYIYRLNGDLEEALDRNLKAIEIQKGLYDGDNINLAESLYIQASILRMLGNFEEALKFQLDSYEMVKAVVEPPHPGLAANLANLGLLQQKNGEHKLSEENNLKALEMYRQLFGEKSYSVVNTYRSLATALRSQGRYEETMEYQQKALDIILELFGEHHIQTAFVYNDLGNTYLHFNELEKAETLITKALEINIRELGEDNLNVSFNMTNLADVEERKGNIDKALEFLNKSLKIRKDRLGENHTDTQYVLGEIERINKLQAMAD